PQPLDHSSYSANCFAHGFDVDDAVANAHGVLRLRFLRFFAEAVVAGNVEDFFLQDFIEEFGSGIGVHSGEANPDVEAALGFEDFNVAGPELAHGGEERVALLTIA